MANEEHMQRLTQGVNAWNAWRQEYSEIRIDLSRADFSGVNLSGASFRGASLSEADLSGADLSGARLSETCLSGASFRAASLSGAIHRTTAFLTGPRGFQFRRICSRRSMSRRLSWA